MQNEYEFINRYMKEYVYTSYIRIVDDSKPYEKITKKKMISKMYESFIEDPSRFDGYISYNALKMLKNIVQNKVKFHLINEEQFKLIMELQDAFLIFFDHLNGYQVPLILIDTLKTITLNNRQKDFDRIYDFLMGVLRVRGQVSIKELDLIYQQTKPLELNISLSDALRNISRIFKDINPNAFYFNNQFEHPDFYSDLVIDDYLPVYKHTWETYTSIGRYGLNIYNPILNSFYEKLVKKDNELSIEYFLDDLTILTQLSIDFDMSRVMQNFIDLESDIDKGVSLYNEVIREIPRWRYKGDPISLVDFDKINDRDTYDVDDSIENIYCPCGSGLLIEECCENYDTLIKHHAILEDNHSQLFYGLYYLLLHRTNQKYHIVPHASNLERFFDRLSQPDFVKIASKFFESPQIIDEYINKYKGQITDEQLDILNGFKYSYKSTFIALRFEDQKLLLLDEKENHIYFVSGIVSAIALNIPNDVLPQFVDLRLIPLKHMITYDVFIYQTPVIIGHNMRKELKKMEKKCRIIKNFNEMINAK